MDRRTLHGVNLTGWLTLESWVTPGLFADSGALDEPSLIRAVGIKRYQEIVHHHRATFISQADFVQIAGRGFNAVRLTVPWYVLGDDGPETGPYVGCIQQVDTALEWAEDVGLKLLLVLGVNPGREADDGGLVHGRARFVDYRQSALQAIATLARRYALRDGFVGIEVADEPLAQVRHGLVLSDGVPMHILRTYYRDAYEIIRKEAGEDAVVILPDADLHYSWRSFMGQRQYKNVWLDAHLYHYEDKVDATGPVGVRKLVASSRAALKAIGRGRLPVMVGKWSGSLPFPDSLMTPEGRIALERVFIAEQINAFRDCPAWFFQTWKTTGRLIGWDARVALATFERRMLD
ncbi:cellulase family glycosylhydrolase [Olegusella massiliensis]|uniref:cellulase family glycosylhydrolase n=1 Tax=Olegusella massiliensis TaxID=1776381 RepID=UPI0023F8237D|nr:cellulase family glycosylhydrolase [Olegusella massiliensis]